MLRISGQTGMLLGGGHSIVTPIVVTLVHFWLTTKTAMTAVKRAMHDRGLFSIIPRFLVNVFNIVQRQDRTTNGSFVCGA